MKTYLGIALLVVAGLTAAIAQNPLVTSSTTPIGPKASNGATIVASDPAIPLSVAVVSSYVDGSLTSDVTTPVGLATLTTTVAATSTPAVLGSATNIFTSITFVGDKAPRTLNTSTIWIQLVSADGTNAIPVRAGEAVTWTAPLGRCANASQFYVDVETADDGVVAVYSVGETNRTVTLGSVNKTVSATNTPEALSATSTLCSSITFIGNKSPRVLNATTVWIQVVSTDGSIAIPLIPGQTITWNAPTGRIGNLTQFYIDVETAGDGVVAIYSR